MKFSEYYKYFNDENKIVSIIHECAKSYIRNIMLEQTISIGKPKLVIFNESDLLVHSDKKQLQVEIDSYKFGTSLYLEIVVNDSIHEISINPLYFKKENIKNYLRECEINIKNEFLEIRKINS